MNSLQESYLKALNPTVSIKIENLDGKKQPNDIIEIVRNSLLYKYNISLDEKNGVIYVGKRI